MMTATVYRTEWERSSLTTWHGSAGLEEISSVERLGLVNRLFVTARCQCKSPFKKETRQVRKMFSSFPEPSQEENSSIWTKAQSEERIIIGKTCFRHPVVVGVRNGYKRMFLWLVVRWQIAKLGNSIVQFSGEPVPQFELPTAEWSKSSFQMKAIWLSGGFLIP